MPGGPKEDYDLRTFPSPPVDNNRTHCLSQELDATLEPILLQQKFKQGGQDMIRLGDNTVPYNDQFRLIMITKLPNPEYTPEVQAKHRGKHLIATV